jgi:HlyD family secretion protein
MQAEARSLGSRVGPALRQRGQAVWSHAGPHLDRARMRLSAALARLGHTLETRSRALVVRLEPGLRSSQQVFEAGVLAAWRRAEPHAVRARDTLDGWTDGRASAAVARIAPHATKQRAYLLAGVLVFLLAVSLLRSSSASVPSSALHEVQPGPVTITISERGELRALDSVTISAEADLPIVTLVPEGTQAKTGDLLVRFYAGKYAVALEEAKAAQQVAEAEVRRAEQERDAQRERLAAESARYESEARVAQLDLDELKKKPLPEDLARARLVLDQARVASRHAEARLRILPKLVDKGFVTKETMEEAELKAIAARTDLQAAEVQHAKVAAGAPPIELEKATMRLEQAIFAHEKARRGMESQVQSYEAAIERVRANVLRSQNLIEQAQVKLKRTELYAPRDGLVVYAKNKDGAEQVSLGMIPFEGQALLYLPDMSAMVVDTEVNEIDIGKVRVDGPVEVRLEAYPGVSFRGKVMKIGSLAKKKQSGAGSASGVKVFDVTARIEDQDPRLKPGLSAMVDVIVDRHEQAIAVPLSAVVARDDAHVVFVARGRRVEARPVVLGSSNEHRVVIREGLEPGERVVLAPPPTSD